VEGSRIKQLYIALERLDKVTEELQYSGIRDPGLPGASFVF
jgi:hypothetical protein